MSRGADIHPSRYSIKLHSFHRYSEHFFPSSPKAKIPPVSVQKLFSYTSFQGLSGSLNEVDFSVPSLGNR